MDQLIAHTTPSSSNLNKIKFAILTTASVLNIGAIATVPAAQASLVTANEVHHPCSATDARNTSSRKKKRLGARDYIDVLGSTDKDPIKLVSTGSEHMNLILNKIKSFSDLQQGWDGYGGSAPVGKTVANTLSFLKCIPSTYLNSLSSDSFAPTSYGTIAIEWNKSEDDFVSVEIGNDQIAYFFEIKGESGESDENINITNDGYSTEVVGALEKLYAPKLV